MLLPTNKLFLYVKVLCKLDHDKMTVATSVTVEMHRGATREANSPVFPFEKQRDREAE